MEERLDQTGLSKKERRALRKELKQQSSQSSPMNSFLLWGSIIAAVILGAAWMFRQGTGATNTGQTLAGQEVTSQDWVRGPSEAKITLIEYSDLQCPACAAYDPIVKGVLAAYPQEVRLVYRHFPLRQIHQHAQLAAQAAEAAGLQSKFWEFHDILFEKQATWAVEKDPTDIFVGYAKDLGLDEAKFKVDLNSDVVKQAIEEDYRRATQARINATPSFLVNGKKIQNPRSLEEFKALIDKERR